MTYEEITKEIKQMEEDFDRVNATIESMGPLKNLKLKDEIYRNVKGDQLQSIGASIISLKKLRRKYFKQGARDD